MQDPRGPRGTERALRRSFFCLVDYRAPYLRLFFALVNTAIR